MMSMILLPLIPGFFQFMIFAVLCVTVLKLLVKLLFGIKMSDKSFWGPFAG